MKSLNLSQIMDFPTWLANNKATLFDHILLDTMQHKRQHLIHILTACQTTMLKLLF
jgi:hypothetical protein